MTTGEKIKAAREKAGFTQAELASKLGIPYQSIGQWERGLRNPKNETLQKIADALGCSKWDLVETTTPEEMYRKDIEKYSNIGPVGFPDNPFRQRAVNKISLVISNVDDEGVQAIVDHAEFIEQKYNERKKKDNEK